MTEDNRTGSIFWILIIGVAFSISIWLLIWGITNNNIKAGLISLLITTLIVFTILFNGKELLFSKTSFLSNTQNFFIGYLVWFIVISTSRLLRGESFLFSIFKSLELPTQTLFASISSQLPRQLEILVNGFLIPTAEELFWLITLPFLVFFLLDLVGKTFPLFKNKVVKIVIAIGISAGTFALFHVGQAAIIAFFVSAIIFRTILLGIFIGDRDFDLIPGFTILPAMALGVHMANNQAVNGLGNFILVMSQSFFGILFLLFQFSLLGIGAYALFIRPFLNGSNS